MHSRWFSRRRLVVAAVIVAVFTVTGFFILPPIVKSQLEKRASAELGRKVTVERVRMNPYTLSLTLENFAIHEADGTTKFLGWRRLYVNFDALSSLFGEWVISDVELDGFTARGVLNADQSLNVSDILAKLTAAAPGKPAPAPREKASRPVRIGHLVVTDARVEAIDLSRSKKFTTIIGPLTFDLTNFRTVGERGAPYRFEATTEAGEKLAWSGTLRAEPFQSAGELRIENLVLPKYAPYYADRIQGELTRGTLSLKGRYEIDLTEGKRVLKLSGGAVELRNFLLRDRSGADVVELPAVDVSGVDADALALRASVASVSVNGGHIRAARAKDGTINLLAVVSPPATATPASAPAPAKLPDFVVADLAVKNLGVDVTDEAAGRPAQLGITGLNVSLQKVTLAEGAQIPVSIAFGWSPQGTVKVSGVIALNPVKADLSVNVDSLAVLPLSPYIEPFANVRLTQGAVTAGLKAQAEVPPGKAPVASVAGDVSVANFGLVDGVRNQELAGFASLGLRGLRASTSPVFKVALDEVNVAGPYARAMVNEDKSINLLLAANVKPAVAVTDEPKVAATPAVAVATATTEPGAAPTAQPDIAIGKVVISGGEFSFVDRSLSPGVSMAINQFGGTITGLSSTNMARADVDLKATVDGAGPVSIVGKLDPLGPKPFVDLKVDFKNVDLQPLSPYAGRYAGYELARGKLLLDVKVGVDGKKIDASNVVTLNQFTFGAPVQSPDATKLPVRLAVALLKDIDGRIVIDIPVQGIIDDPDFKIGRVVLRVVVNLLTKAAVSPFSLLGAAFGGGGDELAFQEFAPGSTALLPTEVKKLETMAKALTNRPGLSLDLEGSYDRAADAYALKRAKLADEVRRAVWVAKRQKDANIAPPERLVITPEENAAAIKQLFDKQFPPGTKFGTPLPPPPAVVAPPAAKPSGFFQRVWSAITLANRRAEKKAVAENATLAAEHEKAIAAAVATGLPLEDMTGRLAEAITVDETDLRALAQSRAQRVRDYFVNEGRVSPDRLFMAKTQPDTDTKGKGPRVFLTLE